jgi:Phage integrase family
MSCPQKEPTCDCPSTPLRSSSQLSVRPSRSSTSPPRRSGPTIGTSVYPERFGRTVPKFTKEAGLGHWSIHELRHSCASLLMAMEVPLEVISDQLGHASIRVTSDVYGHLLPGSKAKAAAAMESVLFGPSTEVRPPRSTILETSLETIEAEEEENNLSHPLPPGVLVGRPGLDPGTLGLKVPCSSR